MFAALPDSDGQIDHCPTVVVFCCSSQALATYLGQVGLTSEAFHEFASLSDAALDAKCEELCAPGVEAEEELYRAEQVVEEKKRSRDLAWQPLARLLVARRLARPLEYQELINKVKTHLRKLVTSRLTSGLGRPPTENEVSDMIRQRWESPKNFINSG